MDVLEKCRACRSDHMLTFLPLGDQPPANAFVKPDHRDEPQPAFPLNTQVCLACGLIQVADKVPANFFRQYLYVPSTADLMHRHFGGLARQLVDRAEGGLIVDIGCNDGLLLAACNKLGGRTLGIDPAANLAVLARARGVEVHVDYFGPEVADEIRNLHGAARVIVTTNTFNHIGDLHAFMAGVTRLLADDGTMVIEAPRASELIVRNAFDTVYHEHVSEFSLLSLQRLGAFFDLEVVDVEEIDVHGGSMRVSLARRGVMLPTGRVAAMIEGEIGSGMLEADTYAAFASRIRDIGTTLLSVLRRMKADGLKVAGYGAPAKGNTLLNSFQIGPDLLDFLVDRSTLKQGLLSPGMKIPVLGPEAIEERRPDVLLVLAWNFLDEIEKQQAAFLERGGRFLIPLPSPCIREGQPVVQAEPLRAS